MKTKTALILSCVLALTLAGTSIYLFSTLGETRTRLEQAEETLVFILDYSKEKDLQLDTANEDLAQSREEN